jgi:alkanesulfonate monooxygenase SsuD/methylene tetrahydromethanopterin reductase-like flavin-dependent oxidoreductase (luciferase family)
MVGVNVVVAETDAEAAFLFTSTQQRFTDMQRGQRGKLAPPIPSIDAYWSPSEKLQASSMLACSFVGSPDTVRRGLEGFLAQTGANELMVAAAIFAHSARLRSYELLAELRDSIPQSRLAA